MHELAITESIVAAVAEKLPDVPVRRVRVQVGRLSGIVPDALEFCFELATAGTSLEGAVLDIVSSPGRGRCRTCGAEFDTDDLIALCGCGSVDIEVLGGRELLIREVEVV
jgi:hydrogenase nickel incorporation protein HypA/HybF